jgi:hypothetical protein
MRTSLIVIGVLLGAACVPSEGPLMAAHQDCLGCHGGGGEGQTWTVAGTMGGQGSRIRITDANGWSFTLHAAENGNFYTAEKVAFPVTVSVDGAPMAYKTASRGTVGEIIPVTYGGCNACHLADGTVVTFDEFMMPGSDCLTCHRAGGMASGKRFSVAGTWSGQGIRVVVGGVTMTTNRVGNFYTETPIALPTDAQVVGVGTMNDPPPDYGGCNRCHPFGRDAGD